MIGKQPRSSVIFSFCGRRNYCQGLFDKPRFVFVEFKGITMTASIVQRFAHGLLAKLHSFCWISTILESRGQKFAR